MADLITRAALVMLARSLHVELSQIAHLEYLGAEHLTELRHSIDNVLFDEHAEVFKRVSMLVPIVPLRIAIPIVQVTVPAEMAGRAAGAIGLDHPKKASATLKLIKPEYGAEAAPFIDPRAVAILAPIVDPPSVVAIAREILKRKDYITAAQFVDAATPELIRAVEQGIDDDAGLIHSGAYVHNSEVLNNILRVIVESNPARVSRVAAATANGSTQMRLDALSVLFRVEPELISTVGDVLFGETPPGVIADLVRAYVDEGVNVELLTFVSHLSPAALDIIAANPIMNDTAIVETFVHAASRSRDMAVWEGMLDIAERASAQVRHNAVQVLAAIDSQHYRELAPLLIEAGLWPRLMAVLDNDAALISAIGEVLLVESGQDVLTELFREFVAGGVVPELLTSVAHLRESSLDVLAANPVLLDDYVVETVVRSAAASRNPLAWSGMIAVAEHTGDEVRDNAIGLLSRINPEDYEGLAPLVGEAGLWPRLLTLAASQPEHVQGALAQTFAASVTDSDREHIYVAATQVNLEVQLTVLLSGLGVRA